MRLRIVGLALACLAALSLSVSLAEENPAPTPVPIVQAAPAFGVAEAFRSDAEQELGITWQRLIFSWADIQPGGPDDWRADLYFSPETLQREIDRGVEVTAVLQFTPKWAARNPADAERSVPKNLSLPADNPDNYWAQFAKKIASHYKGRIDRWILWNEPEFKPGDAGAGQSFTWFGSDEEYYMLLKRGYQGIKAGNPDATVVFGATSYWVDINAGRTNFFSRLLNLMQADPEAPANNWFFDVAAFNLQWCPDDILRVYTEMRRAMQDKGIDKPIWLTETNSMPYDDPVTPKAPNGQRIPMEIQADYAVQTLALASAAGYERVAWYRMTDGNVWQDQEVWGLLRDDGSKRPVFDSFKTAVRLFSGATRVTFMPVDRADQMWGTPWPADPASYYPNWQVYQVVFDFADGHRVSALWNADASPVSVAVPARGSGATVVDKTGAEQPIDGGDGFYTVELSGASVKGPFDPDGYYYVGGSPLMIVEQGVPGDAAVTAPEPR